MASTRKKQTAAPQIRVLFPILRLLFAALFRIWFKIETTNLASIRREKRGCILVANHQSNFDPFLINVRLNRQIQFLVSDSNTRSVLGRFIFWSFGSIPKTKSMNDTTAMRMIITAVRTNGIIGIFAEGQCSWDGQLLPIIPATAKLINALKIPLYCASISGSYFCLPRWGRGIARGTINITYTKLLDTGDYAALDAAKIHTMIATALPQSAYTQQINAPQLYRQKHRAERCEMFLFICPHCVQINTLSSKHHTIYCAQCGALADVDRQQLLQFRAAIKQKFTSFEAWNGWQIAYWQSHITKKMHAHRPSPAHFFTEENVRVRIGRKKGALRPVGTGSLSINSAHLYYSDRGDSNKNISIAMHAIQGCNVQNGEILELHCHDTLYQCTILKKNRNAYKWFCTIKYLIEETGSA